MDPYIEACGLWGDFHPHLIEKIYDVLAEAVPDRYTVRLGKRSYVVLAESEGKVDHPVVPDVSVASPSPALPSSTGAAATAVAEPQADAEVVSMRAFVATQFQENFIEVYFQDSERYLVTCIEVLSPSNKRPGTEGWEVYLRKRQGLLLGSASLVEIDLLRGGQKLPMLDPWPKCPYTLLVARRDLAPYCKVWAAHSLRPLPVIPVPLNPPDPPIQLSLQPMVEAIYRRSRFGQDIDYSRPLQPPLAEAEAAWLTERLRAGQTPA
jgi:hypothetical protein